MRITGYILLITGFVILVFFATIGTGEIQAIQMGRFNKAFPNKELISYDAALTESARMNREWAESRSQPILPAVMMFVGAILLDVARRKKQSQETSEEIKKD